MIELVSFKVTVIGKRAPLDLSRVERRGPHDALGRGRSTSAARASSTRPSRTARRSSRASRSQGPAVIEEEGSTLFVEPGMTVERAAAGRARDPDGSRHERPTHDARPGRADRRRQLPDELLPRHGRDDDDDGVLADLQRVARLLVRDLRPGRATCSPRPSSAPRRSARSSSRSTWTIEELGLDAFEEGDVVLHNDPYRGSGPRARAHAAEAGLLGRARSSPSSRTSRTCRRSGAKTPGGLSGDATEVYQEGLLLPPVKIKRRGEDVDDIWKIILSNHRTPRVTLGDFRAMMGSLDLAERRIHTLIDDYGLDFVPVGVGRADGDRRAAHARRDRGDPGRRLHVRRTRSRTTASPTATTRSSCR